VSFVFAPHEPDPVCSDRDRSSFFSLLKACLKAHS
jgi:hypothetical protein